ETLQRCDALLLALERERGVEPGQVRLLGIVETPIGLIRCEEIALSAPGRTLTLAFGLGDFSTEIQVDVSAEGLELLYPRGRLLVAVRAAGMRAPIDGPYLDIHDVEGLAADTARSRGLGYEGRVVVYPKQVETVQRVYSELTGEEAEQSQRIVDAFEAAEGTGSASIQVDGRFVDYPIYDRARQKLRLHRASRQP
ncbi:MAG: HpcH/HpaI aldolase/citrate lyase family protein, partial [Gaiellales bacterium]